jgi:hypothetical protein
MIGGAGQTGIPVVSVVGGETNPWLQHSIVGVQEVSPLVLDRQRVDQLVTAL